MGLEFRFYLGELTVIEAPLEMLVPRMYIRLII
jgi:hypothetical protein